MAHTTEAKTEAQAPDWYLLLESAVHEPGELQSAYKHFRKYSLANRWLASTQLRAAGLPLLPINTFKGWLGVNRPVQAGQKAAIELIMPVPIRTKKKDADGEDKDVSFTKFMLRRHWFHLNQTAGEDFTPEEVSVSEWNIASAMDFLKMQEVPFAYDHVSDTRPSYSEGRQLSVSGLAQHQQFQRLREMARIQLGHNDETPGKNVPADVHLREVEADAAAYLCAATLGIEGLELARHTLQQNLAEVAMRRIPAQCAKRAFSVADQLINAGYC